MPHNCKLMMVTFIKLKIDGHGLDIWIRHIFVVHCIQILADPGPGKFCIQYFRQIIFRAHAMIILWIDHESFIIIN